MSKNYKEAQKYLNNLYVFKNKKEIKSINLENQELKGFLSFSQFPNLELLNLKNNQISEVDVSNCQKLKHLDLTQNNNLTKLTVHDLNFFERLIADTGTLKKSSFFGGKSEWDPQNIGNSNIAPLKIIEKKEKLISCLASYQGSAPTDGYYLFISQDNKYTLEISRNHPIFIQDSPKVKGNSQGNNYLLYKISWLANEKEKWLFTAEDFIEVVKQETENKQNETEKIINNSNFPVEKIAFLGVFLCLCLVFWLFWKVKFN